MHYTCLESRMWRRLTPILLVLLSAGLVHAQFTVSLYNITTGSDVAQCVLLANEQTGENVTVVINMGGRIETVYLFQPSLKQVVSVIDNNHENATAMLGVSNWRGLMLIPYANRINNAQYSFNGTLYTLPMNEPTRNNSIHGLLYDRLMTVESTSVSGSASVTLAYTFDGSDSGYPFLLKTALTYSLSDKGFTVSVNATNVDPSGWPLPFYNSWHAYFLVSDVSKAVITLDPSSAWTHIDVFNNSNKYSNLIPTGHVSPWPYWQNSAVGGSFLNPTYYDDEVKALSQRPMFTHSITDGHINTLFWADSNYNFVQVFTGAPAGWGDQSIAMEAMSGKADAFNNHDGLHIIEAGESFVSQFGIRMN